MVRGGGKEKRNYPRPNPLPAVYFQNGGPLRTLDLEKAFASLCKLRSLRHKDNKISQNIVTLDNNISPLLSSSEGI